MYLLVAVEATSLAIRHLSRRTWHAVHLTSYVTFVVATVHGLNAGTDRQRDCHATVWRSSLGLAALEAAKSLPLTKRFNNAVHSATSEARLPPVRAS